jgi:hypothetical protein
LEYLCFVQRSWAGLIGVIDNKKGVKTKFNVNLSFQLPMPNN